MCRCGGRASTPACPCPRGPYRIACRRNPEVLRSAEAHSHRSREHPAMVPPVWPLLPPYAWHRLPAGVPPAREPATRPGCSRERPPGSPSKPRPAPSPTLRRPKAAPPPARYCPRGGSGSPCSSLSAATERRMEGLPTLPSRAHRMSNRLSSRRGSRGIRSFPRSCIPSTTPHMWNGSGQGDQERCWCSRLPLRANLHAPFCPWCSTSWPRPPSNPGRASGGWSYRRARRTRSVRR